MTQSFKGYERKESWDIIMLHGDLRADLWLSVTLKYRPGNDYTNFDNYNSNDDNNHNDDNYDDGDGVYWYTYIYIYIYIYNNITAGSAFLVNMEE